MRYGFLWMMTLSTLVTAQTVSQFSLPATDGKNYDLSSLLKTHEAAVVIFVATKCPYSNAYNERYNRLAKSLKESKIAFLPINSNDTESLAQVKAHSQDQKFSFPVLKDDGHKVADLFEAAKTPEVFMVDKKLNIIYHGRIDDDSEGKSPAPSEDLLAAVSDLLGKREIRVKQTKAFGCSIKRN